MEGLSPICVERANRNADLNEITALEQRIADFVEKSLYDVFTEFSKTYEDFVDAVRVQIIEDLIDG